MKPIKGLFVFTLASLLGVLVGSPIHAAIKNNATDIKVFVTTELENGQGFVDPGTKQRADSVQDIRQRLGKTVQLVDNATDADVVIEVLSRGGETTGNATTTSDILGAHTRGDIVVAVHVSLTAGDYKTTLVGYSPDGQKFGVWGAAAKGVSNQIANWISVNHDKLIAQRAKQ